MRDALEWFLLFVVLTSPIWLIGGCISLNVWLVVR